MSASSDTELPRDFDIFSTRPVGRQARDHALVEEGRERLLERHEAEVLQDAREEPRVQEVQDRVLDAADVLVDGRPLLHDGRVEGRLAVLRVDVPEVIPGRVHERVHRVRLAAGRAAARRARRPDERSDLLERIAALARERRVLRQDDGQVLLRHRYPAVLLAMDHRNRRAPVALARDEPVAEPIPHARPADPASSRVRGNQFAGGRRGYAENGPEATSRPSPV